MYNFLGIINLMSSAVIFTSAHIIILLVSLHVFLGFFEPTKHRIQYGNQYLGVPEKSNKNNKVAIGALVKEKKKLDDIRSIISRNSYTDVHKDTWHKRV